VCYVRQCGPQHTTPLDACFLLTWAARSSNGFVNANVRTVHCGINEDHITPLLQELHWLMILVNHDDDDDDDNDAIYHYYD